MALFSFGQKKPLPQDQRVFSILLSNKTVQAIFWEVIEDHLEIISQSELKFYSTEPEAAIKLDECLQELGPESEVATQTLFHLDHNFFDQNGILPEKEVFIKQLVSALNLRSIGFASNAEALIQIIENRPNHPSFQLIIEADNQESRWILYTEEKNLLQVTVANSTNQATDYANTWMKVQTAIQNHKVSPPNQVANDKQESNPASLLVTFSSSSLLKSELIGLAEFIPNPEAPFEFIGAEELLSEVVPPAAVALARSCGWLPEISDNNNHPDDNTTDAPSESTPPINNSPEQLSQKVDPKKSSESHWEQTPDEISQTQSHISQQDAAKIKKEKSSQLKKTYLFIAIFGGLLVALLIFILIIRFTSKTTLLITPDKKTISQDVTITIDPNAKSVDYEDIVLPGAIDSKDFTNTARLATTGKKEAGNPASGSVDFLNKKVGEEKKFSKGTILSANGLDFILNEDITLPGAKQEGDNITLSRTSATLTAKEPGTAGNVNNGTSFKIGDYNTNEYEAQATNNFSGGTNETVAVVDTDDQTQLTSELTETLVDEATTAINSQQQDSERFIALPASAKLTKKEFSAEVNEEADEVVLNATLNMPYLSYQVADLQNLGEIILTSQLPTNYAFTQSTPNLLSSADNDTSLTTKSKVSLNANLSNTAIAQIDPNGWTEEIAGQKTERAQSILKTKTGVVGVEIQHHNPIYNWIFNKTLPSSATNITIKIK